MEYSAHKNRADAMVQYYMYMSGILYACVGLPDTSTYILCVPLRQSGHREDGKIWLLEDAVARW